MKNSRLLKALRDTYLCRCKYWITCNAEDCAHYEPHKVGVSSCMMMSPVQYCRKVKGFVHCVPLSDLDSNMQYDPNLAFKAKRDADKREKKSTPSGFTDTVEVRNMDGSRHTLYHNGEPRGFTSPEGMYYNTTRSETYEDEDEFF